jgi:hypothetical protein
MRSLLLAIGLFVGLIALPLHAPSSAFVRASTAVRMDTRGLVEGADLVLDAHVRGVRAIELSGGRIYTELRLDVVRTFLGEPLTERSVRLPGGVLSDGRGLLLAGVPIPEAGSRCVLFLSPEGAGGVRLPVGLAQGCRPLHVDAQGKWWANNDTAGIALLDPHSGALQEGSKQSPIAYTRLAKEIATAVQQRMSRAESKPAEGR